MNRAMCRSRIQQPKLIHSRRFVRRPHCYVHSDSPASSTPPHVQNVLRRGRRMPVRRVGTRALCWQPLPSGLGARSDVAAGNCSNKRASSRFGMHLLVAGQARTTLNEARSATLQARGRGSSAVARTCEASGSKPFLSESGWIARSWSQFWSQLSSFLPVCDRSPHRFGSVDEARRTLPNVGLRIWKAGWVQALAGSNPASSATPTRGTLTRPVRLAQQDWHRLDCCLNRPCRHPSAPPRQAADPVGRTTPNRIRHLCTHRQ
jgi:hypothetical protein